MALGLTFKPEDRLLFHEQVAQLLATLFDHSLTIQRSPDPCIRIFCGRPDSGSTMRMHIRRVVLSATAIYT